MSELDPPELSPDLVRAVCDELRELARRRLATERAGHTLQATALVHEAYLRLAEQPQRRWADPAHFFHAAAEAMRLAPIDHARARGRDKRGGEATRIPLAESLDVASLADAVDPDEVLALDAAIARLQETNSEAAAVVRLRFFAGLDVSQTAGVLGVSERTVKRKWAYARAWLHCELNPAG